MNISNKKEFDEILSNISELYEEGKSELVVIQFALSEGERNEALDRAFITLQQFRDMACNILKSRHEIASN